MGTRVIFAGHVPAVTRTVTTDTPARGHRRVACKLLLAGYLEAGRGDPDARAWLESPWATRLADLVDLPYWPPRPDQFYPLAELARRAGLSAEIR